MAVVLLLLLFKDGGVMRTVKFVFKPEAVKDQWIFKIPQRPGAHNFVTDRFVKLVQDAGLHSFGFTKVWSDDKDWDGPWLDVLGIVGNSLGSIERKSKFSPEYSQNTYQISLKPNQNLR